MNKKTKICKLNNQFIDNEFFVAQSRATYLVAQRSGTDPRGRGDGMENASVPYMHTLDVDSFL